MAKHHQWLGKMLLFSSFQEPAAKAYQSFFYRISPGRSLVHTSIPFHLFLMQICFLISRVKAAIPLHKHYQFKRNSWMTWATSIFIHHSSCFLIFIVKFHTTKFWHTKSQIIFKHPIFHLSHFKDIQQAKYFAEYLFNYLIKLILFELLLCFRH